MACYDAGREGKLFIWHIFLRHIPGDKLKKKCPGGMCFARPRFKAKNILEVNSWNLKIF
jgi:hypothetical protein